MGLSPGQLVETVAMAFTIPREFVVQIDRKLADVGLRTKGARGVNAPTMTATDAAALIIGTMSGLGGANTDAKTVALARDLADTPLYEGTFRMVGTKNLPGVSDDLKMKIAATDRIRKTLGFPKFRAVVDRDGDGCNFQTALTALIQDSMDGEMEKFLGCKIDQWGRIGPPPRRDTFQLKFVRPYSEAIIGFADGAGTFLEFRFVGPMDTDTSTEVVSTHEITAIPLLRVAGALRD